MTDPQAPQTPQQPAPAAPAPPPSPAADPTTTPTHAKTAGRVLMLIEDDPLLINMYQTKFSTEGFQVFTATDGEAGIKLLEAEKPDIILLDIMMPKLDGIEVLRRIKQNPQLKNTPVLMLSNLSEAAKQQEAKTLGAKDFIVKANFTPTQVVDKVKKHLSNNQTPQA